MLSTFFRDLQTAGGNAQLIHGAKPYAAEVTKAAMTATQALENILCENTNVD